MDYRQAAKDIGAGQVKPVYVCYGPEHYLLDQFIAFLTNKLIEPEHREFAVSKFDLSETGVAAVIEDAETLPFMVPQKLVIARGAAFFTGAKDTGKAEHDMDKLLAYLKSPVDYAVIVFIVDADKLDERKTVVKTLKAADALVPFAALSPDQLLDWVRKGAQRAGFDFAPEAAEQLILYTGGNLQLMAVEIDKMALYLNGNGTATTELVEALVSPNAEQNVFLLVEEAVKLRIDRALRILEELLKQREEPIKIVMLIARQFRIVLQVKELQRQGYSQSQIASQIGVHPFAVKIAEGQARGYDVDRLAKIIGELADLDYQMKSGRIDKTLGLELFLMRLAHGQGAVRA